MVDNNTTDAVTIAKADKKNFSERECSVVSLTWNTPPISSWEISKKKGVIVSMNLLLSQFGEDS